MLAGFTTEEVEADTVADQELKIVNQHFRRPKRRNLAKNGGALCISVSLARWTISEGIAQVSCENMQVGSDVREDGSAGKTEPAAVDKKRKSWICDDDIISDVITISSELQLNQHLSMVCDDKTSRYFFQEKPADSYSDHHQLMYQSQAKVIQTQR
ncbi:hypothetical protein F511_34755 [Dorcoceras hygrometricum]|uniref:Uncharacterized protein n=1 Tax=Dorcoceras hygrometricum TaxID=472368 RepID=A0A2Z7AXU3_9LAMI|nr:hypothetical protein F511_34755 [Dorcoceras hygrometricum]